MPPVSTPLLGFKPPFVNDGVIVLPVLTGTGDCAHLTATPSTWQRIADALAPLHAAQLRKSPRAPTGKLRLDRAPLLKPGTRRIL